MNKLEFALRRRWPILLVGLLLGAVVGAVTAGGPSAESSAEWEGKEIVFLDISKGTTTGVVSVSQGAEQLTRGQVAARAAQLLKFRGDPSELAESVVALPLVDSLAIEVTARDTDAQRSVDLASAFASAFIEISNAKDLADNNAVLDKANALVNQTKTELDNFDLTYPEVRNPVSGAPQALVTQRVQLDRAYRDAVNKVNDAQDQVSKSGVFFSQGAEQPTRVDSQRLAFPTSLPLRTAALAFITLIMSLALVFVLERVSPRIDNREGVLDYLDVPVIGEVGVLPRRYRQGKKREAVSLAQPSAEAYRRIRSTFQFVLQRNAERSGEERSGVFLLTSASPSEGKSTSVAMTALSMAEAGVPTLVLGCDYRRPVVDLLLGVPRGPGITARAEMSTERPELADIVHHTGHENLWVAAAGRPTRSAVGCADVARELINSARDSGLSVVIDTTPVLVANDAVELIDDVDEIILVVRAGQTTVKSARQAIEQIAQHGRSILGVILVASPALSRMESYYAGYYYEPDEPAVGDDEPPTDPVDPAGRTGAMSDLDPVARTGQTTVPGLAARTGSNGLPASP